MFLQVVTHINTKTGAIGVSGDGQRPDPVIQTGLGTVSDEKGVVADEQGIINEFGFDGQIGGLETRIDEHGVNAAELAEKMSLLNTTVSKKKIN